MESISYRFSFKESAEYKKFAAYVAENINAEAKLDFANLQVSVTTADDDVRYLLGEVDDDQHFKMTSEKVELEDIDTLKKIAESAKEELARSKNQCDAYSAWWSKEKAENQRVHKLVDAIGVMIDSIYAE